VPGSGTAPLQYSIAQAQEVIVKALSASFNGSGAASAWYPCIRILSPSGQLVGQYITTATVAAGGSADASFFPRSNQAAASAGGSLQIDHNGAAVGSEPALDFVDGDTHSFVEWTVADVPGTSVTVQGMPVLPFFIGGTTPGGSGAQTIPDSVVTNLNIASNVHDRWSNDFSNVIFNRTAPDTINLLADGLYYVHIYALPNTIPTFHVEVRLVLDLAVTPFSLQEPLTPARDEALLSSDTWPVLAPNRVGINYRETFYLQLGSAPTTLQATIYQNSGANMGLRDIRTAIYRIADTGSFDPW
jgi:hypothetical protein